MAVGRASSDLYGTHLAVHLSQHGRQPPLAVHPAQQLRLGRRNLLHQHTTWPRQQFQTSCITRLLQLGSPKVTYLDELSTTVPPTGIP